MIIMKSKSMQQQGTPVGGIVGGIYNILCPSQ